MIKFSVSFIIWCVFCKISNCWQYRKPEGVKAKKKQKPSYNSCFFHCTNDTFLSGSSSYTCLILERILCLKGIQNSFGCLFLINQLFWKLTDSFGALKYVCLAEQDNENEPVWALIISLAVYKSALTTLQCCTWE